MKQILIFLLITLSAGLLSAQTDYEQYRQLQQKAFVQYRTENQEKLRLYRDSLNRRYADFLEQGWKQFTLQKPEPSIKKPITVPPVYIAPPIPLIPKEIPTPDSVITIPTPVIPSPQDAEPQAVPAPRSTIGAVFFGTDILLNDLSFTLPHLSSVTEKSVAGYWRALIAIPHMEIANDVLRIQTELEMNDWGLYQLLGTAFKTYIPHGNANEQIVFTVFMLNQMGYRAKIGRSGNDLISLISFTNEVTNCSYFCYGVNNSFKYYTVNPQQKDIRSVETCAIDYTDGLNTMNLSLTSNPKFALSMVAKELTYADTTYTLRVNRNLVDFYKDYPCMKFAAYVDARLDPITLNSMNAGILPKIINKTQLEAVNWLLHFVQYAFDYKTDDQQFGYEKFFFAEETIVSTYSDCEDRAILFTQLVRYLLKMEVVLLYYPGVHLAAAVKFDDVNISGDYIVVDGNKYLVCDPTYIGAGAGNAMPQCDPNEIRVIKI